MASGFNTQEKRNTLDRLSNLPDEVTAEILKHLPIKEAVRTSRLSRHWRYQWMGIQELKFNDCITTAQGQTLTTIHLVNWVDNAVKWVNNALLVHHRPVTRFEVYTMKFPSSDVDRWLLKLFRHHLQHLILCFRMAPSTPYYMPSRLFYCQNLRTLELDNCALRLPPPPQFGRFKFLTKLILRRACIAKRTLESLVTNSPLQFLCLVWCSLSSLSIFAPNLEHCHITGPYQSINFVHAPKLKKACLSFNSEDMNNILADLWQYRNSPFLKEIDIHAWQCPPRLLQSEHFWEKTEAVLQHLQKVNFVQFKEGQNELQLIEFFLHKATILQTINITQMQPVHFNTSKKLLQFPRTSSEARINII